MTDFTGLTGRAQQVWAKGDFNRLAVGQVIVGRLDFVGVFVNQSLDEVAALPCTTKDERDTD